MPLKIIYKKCLEKSYFLIEQKKANVVPVHKMDSGKWW